MSFYDVIKQNFCNGVYASIVKTILCLFDSGYNQIASWLVSEVVWLARGGK